MSASDGPMPVPKVYYITQTPTVIILCKLPHWTKICLVYYTGKELTSHLWVDIS